MLKTLLLTIDFPPQKGGVARYLDRFANYFADRIFVIANQTMQHEDHEDDTAYEIQRRDILFKYFRPRWIKSVILLIKSRNDYDQVLISHVLPLGTAACLAKMITNKPYLIIVHGMDIRLASKSCIKKWLCKNVLQNAKVVIANSKALQLEVEKDYAINNAIVSYPCFEEKETKIIEHEGINLLTVSRLVSRKGHLRVIQALDRLIQKDPSIKITYHIVGKGLEQKRILSEIYRRKLDDYVLFHIHCSDNDLDALYAASDIFVMPVHNHPVDKEGFGMVYLEAAQYGMPSIATNMSGVDEAVIDGQTGILIKDGDIDALENSINQLIKDVDLRHKLGNAAKDRASKGFSPNAQLEQLKRYL
jgi:phosphatidyl-myo-inositol dimannoside synthase